MIIQGLPTQPTTASGPKFGDRGYDDEKCGHFILTSRKTEL